MNAAEPPSLTLEITKGPRQDDSFTYHPTTDPIVRIGRLVRGNNLPIKDAGISSKHLTIHFIPSSCNWILTDLDSSNGTFVNGSAVGMEPGKGYVVRDGDRVKIGETTDFVCRVLVGNRGGTGLGLRKNPRRRGNLGEEKDRVRVLEEIGNGNDGGEEGGVLEEKRRAVRRRGPSKDGGVSKEVGVGCQREAKGKENTAVVSVSNEVILRESEMKRSEDCLAVAVEESKRRKGGRKDNVSKAVIAEREPLGEEKDGFMVLEEIGNGNGGCEEGGVLEENRPATRRRGLRKDVVVSKEVGVGCQREAKGKENSSVVRVSNEVILGESEMKLSEDCPVVAVEGNKRRRGGRKNVVSKVIIVKREPLEEPIEVERVVQVVENVAMATRASTRRTRGRPKEEEQLLDNVLENDGLVCGDNKVISTKTQTRLRGRRKNVRAAKELKMLDVIEEFVDEVSENKENKDISNSIQWGIVERGRDLSEGNQDSGNIDEEKECDDPPGMQKGSTGCDDTTDVRNEIGSEAKVDVLRNDQEPDLSKITVREWLDWLEVNLPKKIIAETEKLIEEMRSKARRVKEYRAEQMMKREVK